MGDNNRPNEEYNIEELGIMEVKDLDDANIPVNIFISDEPDEEEGGKYVLSADVYQPRSREVLECGVKVLSDNQESLRSLVDAYMKPLYTVALKTINEISEGKSNGLYYWLDDSGDSASLGSEIIAEFQKTTDLGNKSRDEVMDLLNDVDTATIILTTWKGNSSQVGFYDLPRIEGSIAREAAGKLLEKMNYTADVHSNFRQEGEGFSIDYTRDPAFYRGKDSRIYIRYRK